MSDKKEPSAGAGLTRREALRLTLAAGMSATAITLAITDPAVAASTIFLHGVASGDPTTDRVVIWTRVTRPGTSAAISVQWNVASDAAMTQVVKTGSASATAARDHTVKVDVAGLQAGRVYYYQFKAAGDSSPVGRTRTLATGNVQLLKFAVMSCSNYELGYFNAYREAAKHDDLDFVLHLGDYIYEYGPSSSDGYITPANQLGLAPRPRVGQLNPPEEVIALDQYRARHALYKTDAYLKKLHAANPFFNIWDDHEVANDSYRSGAENHQPETEGPWTARRKAGIQAFYEWLPIRETTPGGHYDPNTGYPDGLYRSYDIGSLARLILLDTREAARNKQLTADELVAAYVGAPAQGPFPRDVTTTGENRTVMGRRQDDWFASQLATSTQTWQLIGNQILMFYQGAPDINGTTLLTPQQKTQLITVVDQVFGAGFGQQLAQLGAAGLPFPIVADSWTGYPNARIKTLKALATAKNPVVFSGDSHNAWTANLRLPTATGATPIGVEFGGTSVSSPGYEQYLIGVPPEAVSALLVDSSARKSAADKLVFADASRRGYMLVVVTPTAVTMDHVFLSTVFEQTYTTETKRFRVLVGAKSVTPLTS